MMVHLIVPATSEAVDWVERMTEMHANRYGSKVFVIEGSFMVLLGVSPMQDA